MVVVISKRDRITVKPEWLCNQTVSFCIAVNNNLKLLQVFAEPGITFVVFVASLLSGALIMVNTDAAHPTDHIHYLKVSHTSI